MKLFISIVEENCFPTAKELFFRFKKECYSIFYAGNSVLFSDEQSYNDHKKIRIDL